MRLGVPVAAQRDEGQWQLVRAPDRMCLCSPRGPDAVSIDLDLGNGPLARRIRQSRRDEPLPRAVSLHRRDRPPRVLDATAGLCRDAMVLAHLGCQVTAVERIPALAFLASTAIEGTWLARNLAVVCGDSLAFLSSLPPDDRPDVVYLDPMFETKGRAQVKKDMQVCRALAGPPTDSEALLAAALRVARERVVVKREATAKVLAPGVAFAVDGERVRFDVYLVDTPQ